MTSKLTRERLAEIAQFGFSSAITPANDFEIKELARMALAAMDSKPVFFIEVEGDDWINAGRIEGKNRPDLGLLPDGINYLYAAPQPLTDAEREELQERRKPLQDKDLQGVIDALEHPAGINAAGKQVVRHALLELQERRKADDEPVAWTDEEELRDVNVAGIGYLFGIDREANKFADPRRQIMLYRHAQPAPEKYNIGDATMRHIFTPTGMTNVSDMQAVFDRVEAVLVGMERTAPEYPEVLPCPVLLGPWLRFGKGIKTSTMLAALARRAVYESDMAALSPEEIAEFQARIEDFKALIAQPAPVVPDDVLDALQKVARIRLDLNDFDGDRRGIADCLCDAEEALIEVVNRRAAMLSGGKS